MKSEAYHRLLLEKYEIEVVHAVDIPRSLTDHAEIQMYYHPVIMAWMCALRTWAVKGAECGTKEHFSVPATWWDHLKIELFLRVSWWNHWALKHLKPVAYTKLEYVTAWVCPHMNAAWPNERHLQFIQHGPASLRR